MIKYAVNHSSSQDTSTPISVQDAQREVTALITQALLKAQSPVSEMTAHLTKAQGKGVRTLLLLYAAMDSDGLVSRDAISTAAALEIFHLATLVHDDVIDDAPLRRGIPTLQHRFGRKQAVICGDYLLCLAASLMVPMQSNYQEYAELTPTVISAISRICLGELKQFQHNGDIDLDIPGYLRIIAGKTASLFYVSAYAGAIIARYDHDRIKRLARFGRYLGMVFQIVDDCKDYECSEEETKKTVGKDIAEGVVTLPLIYALQNVPQLRQAAKDAFSDAKAARQLVQAVCDAGGTKQSHDLAARYAQKACMLLDSFPANKTRPLMELLDKNISVIH